MMSRVSQDGLTDKNARRAIDDYHVEQLASYDPYLAIRPLLDAMINAYVTMDEAQRVALRTTVAKFACFEAGVFDYVNECISQLKATKNGVFFRQALIAVSIDNCAHDFRDTHALLAELAIAAVATGTDIEKHGKAVADLSTNEQTRGGCYSMKATFAKFHIYAPTAKSLF